MRAVSTWAFAPQNPTSVPPENPTALFRRRTLRPVRPRTLRSAPDLLVVVRRPDEGERLLRTHHDRRLRERERVAAGGIAADRHRLFPSDEPVVDRVPDVHPDLDELRELPGRSQKCLLRFANRVELGE